MTETEKELVRLAGEAEAAGYKTPQTVIDYFIGLIHRQQLYLARRKATRQVSRYDSVVARDTYVLAAAIQWLRMKTVRAGQDTAPFIRSRRIKRLIRIQEQNTPPVSLFDVTVEHPSDQLPEWFAPLQPIVEDETFTDMHINLGQKTHYHLSIVGALSEGPEAEQQR